MYVFFFFLLCVSVIKLFSATNYNLALLKIIKKLSVGCADVKEFIALHVFPPRAHLHHWFCRSSASVITRLSPPLPLVFFFFWRGHHDTVSCLINDGQGLILFTCVYDFYRLRTMGPSVKLGKGLLSLVHIKQGAFIMTGTLEDEHLIRFVIRHSQAHKTNYSTAAFSPGITELLFIPERNSVPLLQNKDELWERITETWDYVSRRTKNERLYI